MVNKKTTLPSKTRISIQAWRKWMFSLALLFVFALVFSLVSFLFLSSEQGAGLVLVKGEGSAEGRTEGNEESSEESSEENKARTNKQPDTNISSGSNKAPASGCDTQQSWQQLAQQLAQLKRESPSHNLNTSEQKLSASEQNLWLQDAFAQWLSPECARSTELRQAALYYLLNAYQAEIRNDEQQSDRYSEHEIQQDEIQQDEIQQELSWLLVDQQANDNDDVANALQSQQRFQSYQQQRQQLLQDVESYRLPGESFDQAYARELNRLYEQNFARQ